MATQALDPAVLKAMREGFSAYGDRFEIRNGQFFDKQTGQVYDPQNGGAALSGDGSSDGGAGRSNYAMSDYLQYDPNKNDPGDPFKQFNSDSGEFVKDGQFAEVNGWKGLAQWAAMAAAMGIGLPALMGQLGAGAGAVGGAGGFIGEGALSGIPAWDAAMAGATAGEVGAAAGSGLAGDVLSRAALDGTNVFGANSVPGALNIDGLVAAAPGAPSANAVGEIARNLGYTGGPTSPPSGVKPGAPPGAPSGSGGPSLTDIGRAAGAVPSLLNPGPGGGGEGGTQTRDLPDWLKPYVAGENGLAAMTHGLLQQQMPIAQQQGELLRNKGNSLLDFTPAGNGFAGFQQRRF